MENLYQNFFSNILNVINKGVFGLDLFEIFIILISFLIALSVRGLFAKIVVSKIKKFIYKTGNKIDDDLFLSLEPPFKLLPIVLIFLVITLYFELNSTLGIYFQKINNTLSTIFVFWLIHQSLIPFSKFFNKLEKILSKALVV